LWTGDSSRDLFIVMNAHHENWIKDDYANPLSRARFDSIWSQIAFRFKDKSEKLIFEIINEPHGLSKEQNNELHQRILDIIRKTNPTRNVIIQGHNWGGADELTTMAIPDDDHLIGSFHSYDPWPFGLEGTGNFGAPWQIQELDNKFARVKSWSEENNIPVFLGEFGCNKSAEYNSRMKHYRTYVNLAIRYGISFCAWDDGGNFEIMHRNARTWNEIKDILIGCSSKTPTITGLSIFQDTLIMLDWSNGAGGQESTSVQRRIESGDFITIASLSPDSTTFIDHTGVEGKAHYYRIIAHHAADSVAQSNPLRIYLPAYEPKVRRYFLGFAPAIPGVIEAEDFDIGGEGLSYHDMDSRNIGGAYRPDEAVDIFNISSTGYHIGNALPGEWFEYSVVVDHTGEYLIDVHYATIYGGGTFVLKIGNELSDTMKTVRTDSWLLTDKVSFPMNLTEGAQLMRFTVADLPIFTIDKFTISVNTTGLNPARSGKEIRVAQDPGGVLLIQSDQEIPIDLVQLYHISGALVLSRQKPNSPLRISLTGLDSGIYLVRTYSGGRVFRNKLFIK